SDNVGRGAPGDSTFALRWLLRHEARSVAMAILYDPQAVRIAMRAGVGARLSMRLGGKLGPLSGNPVDLEAAVLAIRTSYMHAFAQQTGEPWLFPLGD